MSKLAKYPAVYSKILLSTPADGSPLSITLADERQAARERLQFYNFLKFVRRNPRECAHLHIGNRANLICISMQGNTLHFSLKGQRTVADLESAFTSAAKALNIPTRDVPLPIVADESSEFDPANIRFDDTVSAPMNPMEIFLNAQEAKERNK